MHRGEEAAIERVCDALRVPTWPLRRRGAEQQQQHAAQDARQPRGTPAEQQASHSRLPRPHAEDGTKV